MRLFILLPLLLLPCSSLLAKPAASKLPRAELVSVMQGDYVVVGKKPDAQTAYVGRLTFRPRGDKLAFIRTVAGRTVRGVANAGGAHPEIRFTTAAGEVVEYPQGGMIWGYRVGDQAEVLYEPENPTGSAVINRPGALWGFVAMDFLMGAGFVLLSQLAWWRPDWIR